MTSTARWATLFVMMTFVVPGQAEAGRCKNLSIPCLTKAVTSAASELTARCVDFAERYPQWQTRRNDDCAAEVYTEEERQAALDANEEPFRGTLWHRRILSCQVNWSERHTETCRINEAQKGHGEYTSWDGDAGYRILSLGDLAAIPQDANYADVVALFGKPLTSELPLLAWLKKRPDIPGEEASSVVRWRNAYWFLFEKTKPTSEAKSVLSLKLIASTPVGHLANDKAIYEQFRHMTVDWPSSSKGQRVLDHLE